MKALLLALLFASTVFAADPGLAYVYRDVDGNTIRLTVADCKSDAILARTPPQYRKVMRAGEASIGGTKHPLCWLSLPGGVVGMLYEDGDQGRLPAAWFTTETRA